MHSSSEALDSLMTAVGGVKHTLYPLQVSSDMRDFAERRRSPLVDAWSDTSTCLLCDSHHGAKNKWCLERKTVIAGT